MGKSKDKVRVVIYPRIDSSHAAGAASASRSPGPACRAPSAGTRRCTRRGAQDQIPHTAAGAKGEADAGDRVLAQRGVGGDVRQGGDDYLVLSLSKDEREPKERHVRAIVINTWRRKSCQPFFKEISKIKDVKNVPLVGYKVLDCGSG